MINWSTEQEAIFATNASKESISVEAVAGSGKTTTIVELANRTKACRALAVAFNKKTAEELEAKLPQHFTVKTMNALGHQIWGKFCNKRLKLDSNKLWKLANEINIPEEFVEVVVPLVKAARAAGIASDALKNHIRSDIYENWADIADKFDLEFSRDILIYAQELLARSIKKAFEGLIDFDDQIYMSTLSQAKFPTYDLILIDEVQDLSLLQHEMIAKLCHSSTRIIAVGDSRQAIYGFRGAHSNSMQEFATRFKLTHYPLYVSFRCPQAITEEARTIVPHIKSHNEAPLGQVHHMTTPILPSDLQQDSAVLCRNTAPLVKMAWECVRAGVSFKFQGRELGKQLLKLLDKLTVDGKTPTETFLANLNKWTVNEIARYPRREGMIRNKSDTLETIAEDTETAAQIKSKIQRIFEATHGYITFSTVHRAKGLEWSTVYLLRPDLIPSQYANQDWQVEQENNLLYVAITRAQDTFIYLH
jgi:superfamily I DNA/RNA helicase